MEPNFPSILSDSLSAAGVKDADLTVQIIQSTGVDLNSLIEDIIVSDDSLKQIGVDPESVTATIFRDYLIQSLSLISNKQHKQHKIEMAKETAKSKNKTLRWTEVKHTKEEARQSKKINKYSGEVPQSQSTNNVKVNLQASAWGKQDRIVSRVSWPKSNKKRTNNAIMTSTTTNTTHHVSASVHLVKKQQQQQQQQQQQKHNQQLQFLASMFDFSPSVVSDVFDASNQDIEKSIKAFLEILDVDQSDSPPLQTPPPSPQSKSLISTPKPALAVLPPNIQLSNLFPDASTSEISLALSRFDFDLELAAAYLMKVDDMRRQKCMEREEKKKKKKFEKLDGRIPKIKVVLKKKENVESSSTAPSSISSRSALPPSDEELEAAFLETESVEYLHKRMEDCFQRAALSWTKGQMAHAGILSEEGRKYRKRRKLARLRDSTAIFNKNNNLKGRKLPQQHGTSCTVDLHGLHQSEAIQRVQMAIESFQSERRGRGTPKKFNKFGCLDIVTGRGRHSYKQKSKLMPAVEKWLKQHGMSYEVFSSKGFIRVKVKL
jgi:hypothetical protein